MLRPLGRVVPAPVQRFDDKHPDSNVGCSLDWSDWVDADAGDTLATVDVTSSDLTISDVASTAAGAITFQAAGGTAGADAEIAITAISANGRVEVQVWNLYVLALASVASFFIIGVSAVGSTSFIA